MKTTTSHTVLPPEDPGDLMPLNTLLPSLPPGIREGVGTFVDALSRGDAVRIEPVSTMLSTTQAAEILNISRTTLVKLLEEGKLPYEQPNVHRMVRLEDVLTYKKERSRKRTAYFQDSMRQAEETGMLQEEISDYTAALKKSRNRRRS